MPTSSAAPLTLGAALGGRDNALNFMRLILAIAVIYGHVFPLGGFQAVTVGPFIYGGFHGQAVNGFFIISGYLILGSALRQSSLSYFWRRFLRIYPGYLIAVLMVALVFAPLSTLGNSSTWDPASALQYVAGALDLKPSQDGIDHTLAAVPWAEVWNGSLWTLFYEFLAYIATGFLVMSKAVRRYLPAVITSICALLSIAYIVNPSEFVGSLPGALPVLVGNGLRLGTYFAWGMLAYVVRDRIRPTIGLVVAAWGVFFLTQSLAGIPAILALPATFPVLAYAVLGFGAVSSIRLGQVNDISYGIYIYAFPAQQLLILWGIAEYGLLAAATTCFACTLPLALASWKLVEQPCLELKRLVPSRMMTY